MTIIDRYVLRLFAKVLVVCFISLTGLYVVIDAFNNLEEFIDLSKEHGGLARLLTEYYVARAFWFFDRTSYLLALVAAIFAITWLQRSNELAAIMAGGIPQMRIIKPILIAVGLVSVLAMINRECLIPKFRENLVRTAQRWSKDQERPLNPRYDHQTEIFIRGKSIVISEQKVIEPIFQLPPQMRGLGNQISADSAVFQPEEAGRPSGYLFTGVRVPEHIAEQPSIIVDGTPIILTPQDASWLEPNQCLVTSTLTIEQLANGDSMKQYSSTLELIKDLRSPGLDYGANLRVMTHARILQPLLDISLVLIGLPIVVGRRERNFFVASGLCLLMVAAFIVIGVVCHDLGASGWIRPVTAAWAPLMLMIPLATVAYRCLQLK